MTRTQNRIDSSELASNLTQSYKQIMDLATVPDFKLFVTGKQIRASPGSAGPLSTQQTPNPLKPDDLSQAG